MSPCTDWRELRHRRMAEPGAAEAYEAARLAYELGRTVRTLREGQGWSQARLAGEAGMTQSTVARFELGEPFLAFPFWSGWRTRSTPTWSSD